MWYGEYLDYENCKWRKKLLDELVEECNETNNEVKLAGVALLERRNECKSSCTICYLNCDSFYNQHWNWNLFYLLHVHESW